MNLTHYWKRNDKGNFTTRMAGRACTVFPDKKNPDQWRWLWSDIMSGLFACPLDAQGNAELVILSSRMQNMLLAKPKK